MKKYLLIVLLITSGLSQQPINYKTTLIDSNSIFYLSELPYSGPVFSLHKNGEIESKGNFINGWFEGLWKFWYDNGQLRANGEFEKTIDERTYDNGIPKNGKTGSWVGYHKNGNKKTEGTFKDGLANGAFINWHENGQKEIEGIVINGLQSGHAKSWHKNGKKRDETIFKRGKPNGQYFAWYDNGQIYIKSRFKNGFQSGITTTWYKNGNKASRNTMKMGKRYGKAIEWYQNGEKKIEGNFKNNLPEGLCFEWSEEGILISKKNYLNGEVDKCWNGNHELVECNTKEE